MLRYLEEGNCIEELSYNGLIERSQDDDWGMGVSRMECKNNRIQLVIILVLIDIYDVIIFYYQY